MVIVFSDSTEQSKQYWAGKYPLILLRDRLSGNANAVWWQAHEITSWFGQSQNPSGKTEGKY